MRSGPLVPVTVGGSLQSGQLEIRACQWSSPQACCTEAELEDCPGSGNGRNGNDFREDGLTGMLFRVRVDWRRGPA